MDHILVLFFAPLIGALSGAYFGGYLKRKGENLATHEDVNKLLEQVSAVTTTTKEIEAKISSEVWERQRKWELRKDAVFEVMRELGTTQWLLHKAITVGKWEGDKRDAQILITLKNEVWAEIDKAFTGFRRAKNLAMIVCGKEVMDRFDTIEREIISTARYTRDGDLVLASIKLFGLTEIDELVDAIRNDLRLNS